MCLILIEANYRMLDILTTVCKNSKSAMNTPSKLRAVTDRNASIDELDDAIGRLALQMNVINHDFLVLVRRFDERGGWLRSASLSCAKWLEWRCDLSASAARDRVRVAHAMKT